MTGEKDGRLNQRRRKFLKTTGSGALAISLAGCPGNSGEEKPASPRRQENTSRQELDGAIGPERIGTGGTLHYGLDGHPGDLNCMLSSNEYKSLFLDLVYDYGLTRDPLTHKYHPGVFTQWTIKNINSEKPEVYVNVRREGLKWNDGEPFKPIADVLFTYRFHINNNIGKFSVGDEIESVKEARDSWDIQIRLSEKIGTWKDSILASTPIIPRHIWSEVDYEKYRPSKEREKGPVGTGPATIVTFNPNKKSQLKTRRDYVDNLYALNQLEWQKNHSAIIHGGPFVDTVNFTPYKTRTAMSQAFLNGTVDTHYESIHREKKKEVKNQSGLDLIEGEDSGFTYYGFNCRRTPLDDITLRQAMAFLYDEQYLIEAVDRNHLQKGDYAQPPSYSVVRPDSIWGDTLLTAPESNVFSFRSNDSNEPDVDGVQKFLEEGNVVSSSGTYIGKQFQGAFSGVTASMSSSKHNYSYGSPVSEIIQDQPNTEKELFVNGRPIPEIMDDNPIQVLVEPPSNKPKETKAGNRWANNLRKAGIPAETIPVSLETLKRRVFIDELFDVYSMGWSGMNPFGTTIYRLFHSKYDGENREKFALNTTGYGTSGGSADGILEAAKSEMEARGKRNKRWAKALERIYLDVPYLVQFYKKYQWPINTERFSGAINGVVEPFNITWRHQFQNIYLRDNLKRA